MVAFNRPEIKENSKEVFKGRYWPMVGITILLQLMMGASTSLSPIPFVGPLITAAASILFVGPLTVGAAWLYYRAYMGEEVVLADLFIMFKDKERWVKALVTSLLMAVYTFLWTLLFIVPGIIKSYSYSLAPYLIIEDPSLSPKEAIEKSKELTMGYKGSLFGLDISFIGWGILAALTCGVLSVFWVSPYMMIAKGGAYARIKENGLGTATASAYTAPTQEVPVQDAVYTEVPSDDGNPEEV